MRERRLTLSPECLVMMFSRPEAYRVVLNRLPEDARVVRVGVLGPFGSPVSSTTAPRFGGPSGIELWIESAVFRDDDDDDLPAPQMVAIKVP